MEYDGCINLMKAAIESADKVTTVSPRYSTEILGTEYSHGLSGILNTYSFKLCGILNGIDYDYYNPSTDPALTKNYNKRSFKSGKEANKKDLQKKTGLPERTDVPLISIISRLASHKGLDLITEIAEKLLESDIQIVVLGKGEEKYETFFKDLEKRYPDKMKALIEYDRDLSKRIYASTDIFLMPSKSEPCGLSQMIASRYGAIPVVRETGGLYDSIKGYWEHDGEIEGNGFTFANYDPYELLDRSLAAIELWNDSEKRKKLVGKIMSVDFSWNVSAEKYLALYETI
jgi:starch synthase